MILNELKLYLSHCKVANLAQLSQHLQTEPEFTRVLLERWIAKGKIRKLEKLPGCGSRCSKCLPQVTEVYQWIE